MDSSNLSAVQKEVWNEEGIDFAVVDGIVIKVLFHCPYWHFKVFNFESGFTGKIVSEFRTNT